jgi:hypothetical protein
MIVKHIIAMLQIGEHLGVSENIEIAKGKYKFSTSIKAHWKQARREIIMIKTKGNGGKKND